MFIQKKKIKQHLRQMKKADFPSSESCLYVDQLTLSGSGLARLGQSWDLELDSHQQQLPHVGTRRHYKGLLQLLPHLWQDNVACFVHVRMSELLNYVLRKDAARIWQLVFMAQGFIGFPLCSRANISHIFSSLFLFFLHVLLNISLWSLVYQERWRLKSAYMTHNLVFIICVN